MPLARKKTLKTGTSNSGWLRVVGEEAQCSPMGHQEWLQMKLFLLSSPWFPDPYIFPIGNIVHTEIFDLVPILYPEGWCTIIVEYCLWAADLAITSVGLSSTLWGQFHVNSIAYDTTIRSHGYGPTPILHSLRNGYFCECCARCDSVLVNLALLAEALQPRKAS